MVSSVSVLTTVIYVEYKISAVLTTIPNGFWVNFKCSFYDRFSSNGIPRNPTRLSFYFLIIGSFGNSSGKSSLIIAL